MSRPHYIYKTKPKGKQLEVIENTWAEARWAFLCRPGTGKTKMALDTAGLLYSANKISAMLVIAPNGVHTQWVRDGVPTHLADSVPWVGGSYSSDMGKRAFAALEKRLRSRDMGLRILTITADGLQTTRGKSLAHALTVSHPSLIVVDESHQHSNTKAAGHKAILRVAANCRYKRIATGTLLRQNPFSAYGQFELLGNALLGFNTLASFKSMYAEMLPPTHGLVRKLVRDLKEKTGRTITPQIQAKGDDDRPIYKNLRHLRQQIERYASFLTLADVNGTEPEVRLCTRYVHLTPEQKVMSEELRDLGVTEHAGGILTAGIELTTATRLCQIAGGFVPNDDDPSASPVPGGNPKLDELLALVEELGPDERVVVWCKFTAEIAAVCAALPGAVRYDGTCSTAQRTEAKTAFIEGTSRYFVGQIKAGGTGLDGLQALSNYMVFYSNDYSYTDREQAIARLARTGGAPTVVVYDIMALDSVDADVVRCMQTAQDVHERVLFRSPDYQQDDVN